MIDSPYQASTGNSIDFGDLIANRAWSAACSSSVRGIVAGGRVGKDGIHGATFASGDITEESASDLPAVQVGDPFQEKLLM